MTPPCNACGSSTDYWGNALVLRKYSVVYCRCKTCGFVQTEAPHWLNEAYAEPIAALDTGLVSRNLALAEVTESVVRTFFARPDARYLDYGGGYGLLVRLMRDRGLNFFREDPYCRNLFAQGFDAERDDHFTLATAFEVAEHWQSPRDEFSAILARADNLLFTTRLLPSPAPRPGQWWYYALETGQHISFYTMDALNRLAAESGRSVISDGRLVHLFTSRSIPAPVFRAVAQSRVAFTLNRILKLMGRSRRTNAE